MASRNSNYKDDEMETFLNEMAVNYAKISKSSSLDVNGKSIIWRHIASKVNAVSSISREPEKLMKKWRDFTSRSRCKLKEGRTLNRHEQRALEIMETVSTASDTIENADDIHTTDDVSSEPPEQQPECSTSSTNKHFTPDEIDILVSRVAEHKSTLFGSFSNVITQQSKEKIWEDITAEINTIAPVKRSKDKVKEKWSRCQSIVKCKAAAINREKRTSGINETNGQELSVEEEKILTIIGDEAVYGIDGGVDTGVDDPKDECYVTKPKKATKDDTDTDEILKIERKKLKLMEDANELNRERLKVEIDICNCLEDIRSKMTQSSNPIQDSYGHSFAVL